MLTSKSYMGLRGQRLSNAIGLAAGLCFFIYGYGQGVTGGYLTVKSFYTQFPIVYAGVNSGPLVSVQSGFTIAIWNLGCFCSAVLSIFIGDKLGRRNMVFGGLLFLIVGEVLQTSAFKWGQLLAGRFIAGFGLGFNCATIPAWQAECTKAYRRGTVLMLSAGVSIAAGMASAYWVTFAFRWLDPSSASWRVCTGLQILWAIMAFVVMLFMPESPRWLILQGREGEALEVLSALNDLDIDDSQIHQEFLQIKDAVIEMSQGSFRNVFRMGDYRDGHRVILAVILQFCQQMCGINFMTQYFGTMFMNQYQWKPPYRATWTANILAAGAGTCFFLASFIGVACIDRVTGRRGLMMFGTSGMLFAMIILSIMLWKNDRASLDAGTAFVFIFTSCYAIGWQGMSWIVQVELVPLRIRGPANALSTASNWLCNFIVTFIGPLAFTSLKWKSYLIFVCTNAVILPLIYFFVPETGLRCLEEMDYIFHTANSSPRPWLDVVKIAANEPLWYGKDTEESYDYEASEWHQRHVRFSDEVKDDSGESSTLRPSDNGQGDKISSGGVGVLPGLIPGENSPSPRVRFGSGSESDETAVSRSRSRSRSQKR